MMSIFIICIVIFSIVKILKAIGESGAVKVDVTTVKDVSLPTPVMSSRQRIAQIRARAQEMAEMYNGKIESWNITRDPLTGEERLECQMNVSSDFANLLADDLSDEFDDRIMDLGVYNLNDEDMKLIQTNFEDNHSIIQVTGGNPHITVTMSPDGKTIVETTGTTVTTVPAVHNFRNIISKLYDSESMLERLHTLIDGKKGVKAFNIIKVAYDEGYFTEKPRFCDVTAEFGTDIGYSSAYYSTMSKIIDEDTKQPILKNLKQ